MLAKNIRLTWVTVSDLKRAKDFYVNVMGFTLHKEIIPAQWLELKCGDSILAIYQPLPNDVQKPGQNGIITFTVDNLEVTKKALEAEGVIFVEETPGVPGVFKIATYLDADNNKFQLYERIASE